jgi:hypothetical protein
MLAVSSRHTVGHYRATVLVEDCAGAFLLFISPVHIALIRLSRLDIAVIKLVSMVKRITSDSPTATNHVRIGQSAVRTPQSLITAFT